MSNFFIEFTCGTVGFEFEENELAELFRSVFDTVNFTDNTIRCKIKVRGNAVEGYRIHYGNREVFVKCRSKAAYHVTSLLGNLFCSSINENVYMMHAASVKVKDIAVSFSGISGSGKTSLALLFSKYGEYMGDEYTYLDIKSGNIWNEKHPFQLKEKNHKLLGLFEETEKMMLEEDSFGKAYYIPMGAVNSFSRISDKKVKLKILVYPVYDDKCIESEIAKVRAEELPELILQSVMGVCSPSKVFRNVMNLISDNKIVLIKIRFSDGEDAASKLNEYIEGVV